MNTEDELRESNKHLFNNFIEVLNAHMNGKTIQYIPRFESYKGEWKDITNDCFNDFDLGEYLYRVKPQEEIKNHSKFGLGYYPIPSEYKYIDSKYNLELLTDKISNILNNIPDHSSVIDSIYYVLKEFPTLSFTDISINPKDNTFSLGFLDDKFESIDIYFDFNPNDNLVFVAEE